MSDDEEWGFARPRMLGGDIADAIKVYEHFEEKGYDFKFSSGDTLYFRRKKK
jgi:hypothetical protein